MGTASQKPRPRVLDRLDRARQTRVQLEKATKAVRARDAGKCRACGKPGSQAHHLVYRSHGGRHVESNLVWCCSSCHRLIHAKVLLALFSDVNPEATVTFERNRQWD